jgi:mitochondrial import receptor subunit TOM70
VEQAAAASSQEAAKLPAATVQSEAEIPEVVDEAYVATLAEIDRRELADRLKKAGNAAFGDKSYNKAIDLYSKAIVCRKDPIYYSNRAACWAALAQWDKVVEDSTTALTLDRNYVKAINRRAKAYEELKQYKEALFGYTLSCIIDNFQNQSSAASVEKLLQLVAKEEAKERMANRKQNLPSHTFVNNYFVSFRQKPRPAGLEDAVEFPQDSGKAYLQAGLAALEKRTNEGYEEARASFEKALQKGDLGEFEALAYNMRGTFRCLMAMQSEAMSDLSKAIELDPTMTQAYIKLASMKLEQGRSPMRRPSPCSC